MIIIKNNFDIKKISYIHVGGVVKQYIEFDDYHVLKNIDKFISLGNTSKILFCFDYHLTYLLNMLKRKYIFLKINFLLILVYLY